MKVTVEPVILTMGVRYCLGRSSYAPGLVAGEVIAAWSNLGRQQEVILRDIREWLDEDWHPHPQAEVWRWLLTQVTDAHVGKETDNRHAQDDRSDHA